jgi:predicted GH43/DUF377 family glycosyl hydrolase/lysophospholipase L1-like esterase
MKKALLFLALLPVAAQAQFQLKDGDRVVFYGDSITDQRLYSLYTEVFVRTRFPKMNVSFVHSGWGGDRVTGGGGGDINLRLDRDVFAYKPTVVTVMLGMNDAGYRAFDPGLFDTYRKGYGHIVDRLKQEAPGVRLTLIQPSAYDDVTRPPTFPGGYNGTLLRYSDFVGELARRNGATVADLNTPVVEMLKKADAKNHDLATKIIEDRVHPGDAGHLTMAEGLLKAWRAPGVVSAVEMNAGRVVRAENTKISQISTQGNGLAWTQHDAALPFWLNLNDARIRLVLDSSDFVRDLNQQTVKVTGLTGRYALAIDGKAVGTYTAEELGAGVNLAVLETPMRAQAWRVHELARNRAEAHNQRWRSIQTHGWLGREKAGEREKRAAMAALDKYDAALDREARKAAQPQPHRFTLTPIMNWTLGPFVRADEANPVLGVGDRRFLDPMTGRSVAWESAHVFNPAAVVRDGKVHVLYRAEDGSGNGIGTHTSRLGLAVSDDGLAFTRRNDPVLFPKDDGQRQYEWPGGCEDPRIVEMPEGGYLVTYTQWDRKTARLAVATSPDLVNWTKHGPAFALPLRDVWSKSGSLVTKVQNGRLVAAKIDGKYWMYYGEGSVYAASSPDGIAWTPVLGDDGKPLGILPPRPGKFDSLLAEPGPPAVLTEKGIVLLYNGRNNPANGDPRLRGETYSAGQALFAADDPTKLLDRTDDFFFTPERPYEKTGQFPDGTVFIQGLVRFKDRWMLYYGTADSAVAVAATKA